MTPRESAYTSGLSDLYSVKVDTLIVGDTIEQRIDMAGQIHRRVLNTAEYQIRQALISMGWTPPPQQEQTNAHDGIDTEGPIRKPEPSGV